MAEHGQFLSLRTRQSIAVSVFYGTCSVALSMFNKSILSAYNFQGFFVLLLGQQLLSTLICFAVRRLPGNPLNVPDIKVDVLRSAVPMVALAVLNVGIGLIALKMVNVPVFFSIRRLVVPTVLAYEFFVLQRVPPQGVVACVGVMMLGAVMAASESMHLETLGLLLTVVNNIVTAAASVAQKQFSDTTKMSAFGVLLYTSIIGAPISFALASVLGEFGMFANFAHRNDSVFWICYAAASALGFFLTYSSVLSTTFNSPLATAITGNCKDIFTTLIGATLFGGFVPSFITVTGLVISFIGAFAYSFIKLPPHDQASVVGMLTTCQLPPPPSVGQAASAAQLGAAAPEPKGAGGV